MRTCPQDLAGQLHKKINGIDLKNRKAEFDAISPQFKAWETERDYLAFERKRLAAAANHPAVNGADAAENKAISRVASPLKVPAAEYKGLYEAAIKRLPSYRIDCDHLGDVSVNMPK